MTGPSRFRPFTRPFSSGPPLAVPPPLDNEKAPRPVQPPSPATF